VPAPFAYLVPPAHTGALETLQRHGIELLCSREDIDLDVEVYRIDSLGGPTRLHGGAQDARAGGVRPAEPRRVVVGTIVVVPTAQPLGTGGRSYLLEPRSDDGLFTWNFFDDVLTVGGEVPVLRLPAPAALLTAPLPPLAGERPARAADHVRGDPERGGSRLRGEPDAGRLARRFALAPDQGGASVQGRCAGQAGPSPIATPRGWPGRWSGCRRSNEATAAATDRGARGGWGQVAAIQSAGRGLIVDPGGGGP